MNIKWNTGSAAARFRHTRKKKKKNKAASLQAGGPAHKELKPIKWHPGPKR